MASKVRGSKGVTPPSSAIAPQPAAPVEPSAEGGPASRETSDGYSQAARNLLSHRSSPLVSGALKIFGDNVVLPAHITDPNDPRNDVKYLRLLSAVLGLDELERYFYTVEDKKHQAFLEKKEERRREILEERKREKEER